MESESDMFKYYESYVEDQQPIDESQSLFADFAEPADDEVKPVPDLNESFAPQIEPVFLADNLIHIGIDIDMVSDVDGDGIPDYRDDDDDNDCIPDHLDMDTEVQPIALRLVNGPKFKFDGEQNLAVLISRSQGKENEEQQNTVFSGIFSKAVKSMSLASEEAGDDKSTSSSRDDDVSVFASVFDSFKKSILEEDEDDSEDSEKHEEKDVDQDVHLWPTVTDMISNFFTNTEKSKSDSSRQKGR